ncbi:MAG: aminopeptidase N [Planctomycetota bacterium]|jgi:aminopeptidase N
MCRNSLSKIVVVVLLILIPLTLVGQEKRFTRQDRLRGSISPARAWWDVLHYDLKVEVFPGKKFLRGSNAITFRVLEAGRKLQLDLQEPMAITKVLHNGNELKFEREGQVYWVSFPQAPAIKSEATLMVYYEGNPTPSPNPPWSGGLSWNKDKQGNDFIATTCQGVGASIWWPNKDHGYDEPDRGVSMAATVPEDLVAVSNGRLTKTTVDSDQKTRTFHWRVRNPINNYCINLNIGDYVEIKGKYAGELGSLDTSYWVLKQDKDAAIRHFVEVPRTLEAFEYWFGKYPFYEDSYKLVQVPYLGMEHQSSVTYGNGFKNGYRGRDLSNTGVGLKFDFIIVHESAHEWFGNNISMKDAADMWIHESFANYSESLFVEYFFTRKEAEDYVIGTRRLIGNRTPIIGTYGFNSEGSGDMYYKGGNMLHTMRHIIDNDVKWRSILRQLGTVFWHKTVTTFEIEQFMSKQAGIDFGKFFDQYLRTTKIPTLAYKIEGKKLTFHWENVVLGFDMPVRVHINGLPVILAPTSKPQVMESRKPLDSFYLDRNFYVTSKKN